MPDGVVVSNLRLWLGLVISAASIWLVLGQVDLGLVTEHMARANWALMAVLVASVPTTLWMKAARWRLFFRPDDRLTVNGLFSAMFIGYMVIVIVPLRVGELVRAFLVADGERLSWSRVLATIVVEKVLDVLAVALLLVGLAAVVPLPSWAVLAAQGAGLLLVVSMLGLAALSLAERPLLRLLALVEDVAPVLRRLHLGSFLVSFNQGLGFLKSGRALTGVAAWSVGIWLVAAGTIWAALAGTGLGASAQSVVMVLSITNLGMVVPSAPGYVGTYHLMVVEALAVFGVDRNQALGSAVVLHGLTFGTILVGGLIFLWLGQHSLARLLSGARQSSSSEDDKASPYP